MTSVFTADQTVISSGASNSLTNVRFGNELNCSKMSSPLLNDASESSWNWDINRLMIYESLHLVFASLSIPDRLKASQVCSFWNYVASQSVFWERVSLQGLTITDWEKCCLALEKNGTKALDLRDIVHQNVIDPWKDLEMNVVHLAGVEELICDQISTSLLNKIAYNMPLLNKLECHFLMPETGTVSSELEFPSLRYLGRLVELKISSGVRIELKKGETYYLPYLPFIKHLSLTGFNFHSALNIESLCKQTELISLELGDCREVEPRIYPLLERLTNLKSLRLENGGNMDDCRLSEFLLKIKGLEVLELMNFKISKSLSEAFRELKNLLYLNVWPDNTDKICFHDAFI